MRSRSFKFNPIANKKIHMIRDSSAGSSPLPLVRAISELITRGWMTDFIWISRNENKTIDKLANPTYFDTTIFKHPLAPIKLSLLRML
ncbi:hypothetical protein V6N11_080410 [Hibiscus sabdariffa]|uniref:Uncharacterized protein n=1 Tax=Hibiscus sabdariffa TaxID=183260 RepID=A0ABR2R828_9ROSI